MTDPASVVSLWHVNVNEEIIRISVSEAESCQKENYRAEKQVAIGPAGAARDGSCRLPAPAAKPSRWKCRTQVFAFATHLKRTGFSDRNIYTHETHQNFVLTPAAEIKLAAL